MWDQIILNPMINILLGIYKVFPLQNFGLAIIIFTILINLLIYPLNASQLKSTQKMQNLQKSKEWLDIAKKHKDNKQQIQAEQAKLLQSAGINPLGSCLPLLIQFPIIIGLYQAIMAALAVTPIQLMTLSHRLYPILKATSLIPLNNRFLWMTDLSMPERLTIFGFGIPLLAILVAITTYFSSKIMTPPPADPKDQAAAMGKMMNLYMPFLMGYISYTFSAGLAIYFVTGNIFRIVQYAIMGKVDWKTLIPFIKPRK